MLGHLGLKDHYSSTWDWLQLSCGPEPQLTSCSAHLSYFLPLFHMCWSRGNSLINIPQTKLHLRTQLATVAYNALYYLVLAYFSNFIFCHWCPGTPHCSLLSVLGLFFPTLGSLHMIFPLHQSSFSNSNFCLSVLNLNVTSSEKPPLGLPPPSSLT